MRFLFEVAAVIKSKKLDGSTQYAFQGMMAMEFEHSTELHPMGNVAFVIPEDFVVNNNYQPGDVIAFDWNPRADVPATVNLAPPDTHVEAALKAVE